MKLVLMLTLLFLYPVVGGLSSPALAAPLQLQCPPNCEVPPPPPVNKCDTFVEVRTQQQGDEIEAWAAGAAECDQAIFDIEIVSTIQMSERVRSSRSNCAQLCKSWTEDSPHIFVPDNFGLQCFTGEATAIFDTAPGKPLAHKVKCLF